MTKNDYLIIGLILGMFIFNFILKAWDSYRKKKTYYRAKAAEKRAMEMLESQGYRIIEIQPRRNIYYHLNGERKQAYVKADFLARKYFKKVICEVKTGEKTRITQALIRRQLLDYFYAYGVREVLLIDMEREKVDRITFRDIRNQRLIFKFFVFSLGILLAVFVYIK